jgi:lysozyme
VTSARIAAIAVALAVALAAATWLYAGHWHPSDRDFPVQGVDVSHHQGRIDWPLLPGQGVDFAYIKASEGGDHRDRAFAANWAGAGKAGIARGAYHFFTLCKSGAEQAANFIAAVPFDPDALPPALDLEYMGNCARKLPREALLREVAAYIRPVEARYRKPVILYLTREFDEAYGIGGSVPRPLWLRSLVVEPRFGSRSWHIWQVSNFRRLRGIEGRVDWNVRRP